MVTDYDCLHPDHDNVDVKTIIGVLQDNADRARALIKQVDPRICDRHAICPSGDDRALESALITAPDARDPEIVKRLDAVAGRLLL